MGKHNCPTCGDLTGFDCPVKGCKTHWMCCRDCHDELAHGIVPRDTPIHTTSDHEGLTLRQRYGLGKTGG